MARRVKFRVYLAGPMSGCNDEQASMWRNEVKKKYGRRMDFVDPTENWLGDKATAYEFVKADLDAIESADGLLVNMWRESIGSTVGIVHAHQKGRPVVIANPNHLKNRIMEFYADTVMESPLKSAKALLNLLEAEMNWKVMKSGERQAERFQRGKLMGALRGACRKACCDDIVIPGRVLPTVIENLKRSDRKVRKEITA